MAKSVRFPWPKSSKLTKMIYNSISYACSIVFAPIIIAANLTIQLLKFDQKHGCCPNFTKTSHFFHNGCTALTSLDFRLPARLVHNCLNGGKIQNGAFPILIYKFNIYFSKRRGDSYIYWRRMLVRRKTVYPLVGITSLKFIISFSTWTFVQFYVSKCLQYLTESRNIYLIWTKNN